MIVSDHDCPLWEAQCFIISFFYFFFFFGDMGAFLFLFVIVVHLS